MGHEGQETYSTDSESGKQALLNWLDKHHIDWSGQSADQLKELLQRASGELHLLVPNSTQDTINLFRQLMKYKPGMASKILGRVELFDGEENNEENNGQEQNPPGIRPEDIQTNDFPSVPARQVPPGEQVDSSPGGDLAVPAPVSEADQGDQKAIAPTNAEIRQAVTENEFEYQKTELAINQYVNFIDRYLGALATPPLPDELPRSINSRTAADLQNKLASLAVERLESYSDPEVRKNLDGGQYNRVLAEAKSKVESALDGERRCSDKDYKTIADLLGKKAEIQELSGDNKEAQDTRQREKEARAFAKLQSDLQDEAPDKELVKADLKELARANSDSFKSQKITELADELGKVSSSPDAIAGEYSEIARRLFGPDSKTYADRLANEATALYNADLNGGVQLDQAIKIYKENGLAVLDDNPVTRATRTGLTYGASYTTDDGKGALVTTDEASARLKQVEKMHQVSVEFSAALATSDEKPLNYISFLGLVSLAEMYQKRGATAAAQEAALVLEEFLPVLKQQEPDEDYARLEEKLAKLRNSSRED